MLPFPPQREQGDNAQRGYSDDAAVDLSEPLLTRQEDADAADVNKLLARFGVGALQADRHPIYTTTDDALTLHEAMNAIYSAERAYNRLPTEVRNRYETVGEFIRAMENGQIIVKDEDEKPENNPPTIPEEPVSK